jgi:hypothetical protein
MKIGELLRYQYSHSWWWRFSGCCWRCCCRFGSVLRGGSIFVVYVAVIVGVFAASVVGLVAILVTAAALVIRSVFSLRLVLIGGSLVIGPRPCYALLVFDDDDVDIFVIISDLPQ